MNSLFSEAVDPDCEVLVFLNGLTYTMRKNIGGKTVGEVLGRYVRIVVGWVVYSDEDIFELFEVLTNKGQNGVKRIYATQKTAPM